VNGVDRLARPKRQRIAKGLRAQPWAVDEHVECVSLVFERFLGVPKAQDIVNFAHYDLMNILSD
jgi:hypothetical protein